MSEEQLTVLRAMTWGFRCPALILLAPLSFLRALLLSYLAFPLLSPHNLFYLLSPTVTPFLVIVSIPLFVLSLCGGPRAPQCWESLPAPHPGLCKVCTAGLALCVCFAGASTSSSCRAAPNLALHANKKQPRGTKHLGALQAKKGKKERR